MESFEKHDEELIKELLKKYIGLGKMNKNYTQDQLADISSVSIPVISRIANGRTLITILTFAYLVNALDIDANKLFEEFAQKSKFFNGDY